MVNNNPIWWDHFLYLEELLLASEKHVGFISTNFNTTSITFMHIILAACADIECILKELFGLKSNKNLKDIAGEIEKHHNDFKKIQIDIPSLNYKRQPWLMLNNKDPKNRIPSWWDLYNDIKHTEKDTEPKNSLPYRGASLEYAIEALAGLFSVNLAYYTNKIGKNFTEDKRLPKFFNYPGLEANHLITEDSFNIEIPGFTKQE